MCGLGGDRVAADAVDDDAVCAYEVAVGQRREVQQQEPHPQVPARPARLAAHTHRPSRSLGPAPPPLPTPAGGGGGVRWPAGGGGGVRWGRRRGGFTGPGCLRQTARLGANSRYSPAPSAATCTDSLYRLAISLSRGCPRQAPLPAPRLGSRAPVTYPCCVALSPTRGTSSGHVPVTWPWGRAARHLRMHAAAAPTAAGTPRRYQAGPASRRRSQARLMPAASPQRQPDVALRGRMSSHRSRDTRRDCTTPRNLTII